MRSLLLMLTLTCSAWPAAAAPAPEGVNPTPNGVAFTPWWYQYPTFASLNTAADYDQVGCRMVIHGCGSDPTWGPYARRLTLLDNAANLRAVQAKGARAIAWIEGFGDCMVYAISFDRREDGSFVRRADEPTVSAGRRSHWCWANRTIPQGNTLRWVGLHNTVNDEDFAMPAFGHQALGLPVPTYPDGRPAVGWKTDVRYPLNALVYDACGSKDITGRLYPSFEAPDKVNELDPATGKRWGPVEGLYPALPGKDDVAPVKGLPPGEPVYCGAISIHKDLSAPFWREYVKLSIRDLAQHGLDGVWCDNYSPWDNFGYPPVQKAFGDWSVALFHQHVAGLPPGGLARLGLRQAAGFDVRQYLIAKGREFGLKDPTNYQDPAWRDPRWLDDPVWGAFKAFRQRQAQRDLADFDRAIHQAAAEAGKPDFCVGGNDAPFYGLGWVRDAWLDMINTEITPGWHMGTGSRGIMVPPVGKMAVVYRVALEHQRGPVCAAWYYLDGQYEKLQGKAGMNRLLLAEAFANGAVLLCDPHNPRVAGGAPIHAWWNAFVRAAQARFGRRLGRADVGVLFSPDNQLQQLAPGGFPDMDRQPHIFGHYGWATALVDAHIPYRALTDWKVDADDLKGLKTFIVPDAEALSNRAARALEEWVRAGGTLLVTGPSGTRWGPEGSFMRRDLPVLADLVGDPDRQAPQRVLRRTVGAGKVVWAPGPVGMEYYLRAADRPQLLPGMEELVGGSDLVDTAALPATTGLFTWRGAEEDALFADLVNYDLTADAEQVRPAQGLRFRLRLPPGWRGARAEVIAPDTPPQAQVTVAAGWATVRLDRLDCFASVKLTPAGG